MSEKLTDDQLAEIRSYGNCGAYHYSFDGTGDERIDLILAAVCRAGKQYHLTEDWNQRDESFGGMSPVDVIQETANHVARTLRAQALTDEEREALAEVYETVKPSDLGMPGMVSKAALYVLSRLAKGGE